MSSNESVERMLKQLENLLRQQDKSPGKETETALEPEAVEGSLSGLLEEQEAGDLASTPAVEAMDEFESHAVVDETLEATDDGTSDSVAVDAPGEQDLQVETAPPAAEDGDDRPFSIGDLLGRSAHKGDQAAGEELPVQETPSPRSDHEHPADQVEVSHDSSAEPPVDVPDEMGKLVRPEEGVPDSLQNSADSGALPSAREDVESPTGKYPSWWFKGGSVHTYDDDKDVHAADRSGDVDATNGQGSGGPGTQETTDTATTLNQPNVEPFIHRDPGAGPPPERKLISEQLREEEIAAGRQAFAETEAEDLSDAPGRVIVGIEGLNAVPVPATVPDEEPEVVEDAVESEPDAPRALNIVESLAEALVQQEEAGDGAEAARAEDLPPIEDAAPTDESALVEEIEPPEEPPLIEDTAPADEFAPIEEVGDSAEDEPISEDAAEAELAPMEDIVSAEAELAPLEDIAPDEESSPVEAVDTAEEDVLLAEDAPIGEDSPSEGPFPAEDLAPPEELPPIEAIAPADEPAPIEEDPAGEEATDFDEVAVQEASLADGEFAVVEEDLARDEDTDVEDDELDDVASDILADEPRADVLEEEEPPVDVLQPEEPRERAPAPEADSTYEVDSMPARPQRRLTARLGTLLLDAHLISRRDLDRALEEHQLSGERLGHYLVAKGIVDEEDLAAVLADQYGVPAADVENADVPVEALMRLPEKMARRHMVLPLAISEGAIEVAMPNPSDIDAIKDIEFTTGLRVQPLIVTEWALESAIDRLYSSEQLRTALLSGGSAKSTGLKDPKAIIRRMVRDRDEAVMQSEDDPQSAYELAASIDEFVDEILKVIEKP